MAVAILTKLGPPQVLSVTGGDINPDNQKAGSLPVSAWLRLAGLGGLFGLRRRAN
ncbi:MAG: hypothetical protein AAF686_02780 [Pseudomonadota bacterium]